MTTQNPAPGTKVDQGSTVTFELKKAEDPGKKAVEEVDVKKVVEDYGLGEYVSSKPVQRDKTWYMETVCKYNGENHTVYIDAKKNVYQLDDNGKLVKM